MGLQPVPAAWQPGSLTNVPDVPNVPNVPDVPDARFAMHALHCFQRGRPSQVSLSPFELACARGPRVGPRGPHVVGYNASMFRRAPRVSQCAYG